MASQRHRVFAYGSNMHLPDLERWAGERRRPTPRVHSVIAALLPDHRLAWNYRSPSRNAGAANVLPEPGAIVPGVVLELDAVGLDALDSKEGHPGRYSRGEQTLELVPLRATSSVIGRRLAAWVYRVTPDWERPPPVWPSPEYLALLVDAAAAHRLPAWHLAALRATPTAPSSASP